MIEDMLSWLRQQIETRKALAEAASPSPWSANAEHDEVLAVDGERVADGFALSGNQLRNTVDHIVFNDPRQILTDCEADLAEIAHHVENFAYDCEWCGEHEADFPCTYLRRQAHRYRHRPGYLPEWAPEGTTP
ncbi:DUF6221 family protein [Streptosporangium sp. CA-115845]|uniref:DUF6221 family protein n=1 Tax=Streptosporangium sp. CA-115845 TaxID=3240071 RepID=UPI003D90EFDC